MASKRPHQPDETEETKKTRQDEDKASAAGGDAGTDMGDDSDVHFNVLAVGASNVSTPVVSKSTAQRDINISTNVHHHYGSGTSTPSQPACERDTASIIAEYKTSVQSSYEVVKEYNSRPGENVLLSERYTELQMVECHRKPEEREEEIRSRGECLQEVLKSRSSKAYSPITVEQLFRPDKRGPVPKTVILQGHPGYGKSFTSQKIMLDWASGTLFKDLCHLVLHLECKEMNGISGECSLVDLLNSSPSFTSDIEDVLRDPKIKVLFLVDGFDELKFSLEGASSALPKDPFTKASVQATLKALLRGHILPQYKLLVTTRSTATNTLSHLITDRCFQRFVDILGFTEEGVKDYIRMFFQDKHKADTLFKYVRTNETLYTSCFIPVICWVICSVFRAQELKGPHITLETNTSIYANFVSILLDHHSWSLNLPVPVLLSSLGRLAEKGMKDKCVLFTKKDVLSAVSDPESTVPHLTTGPFLCGFIRKEAVKMEEMFSFMHLSFQEFFTALHYTLDQEGEKRLASLLNSQEHWESHRWPVIQFLFGLANKEMQSLECLQSTLCASSIRRHLEKWIMKQIQEQNRNYDELIILSCLYELHEEEFVGKAMHDLAALSFFDDRMTRMDCWVLRYCLLCCPIETPIQNLVLHDCGMTVEMLRMLQPALSRCEDLSLDLTDVHDDDDIRTFLSSLMKGHKLQTLSLFVLKDSLKDVGEFISSLTDKHILMGQRFQLCLEFRNEYGQFDFATVLLPEASQSTDHLKTVGQDNLSVYNSRTDQIHEDSLRGISYRLVIDLTLNSRDVNDAHDTRRSDDDEAGDSEMTGTSSESTEGNDDDPLQGFKDACSAFEGADSDDEDDGDDEDDSDDKYDKYFDDEDYPAEYDVEELFSSLVHVPGLKEVDIERYLNYSWESDVLSLVNHHPTLQTLRMGDDDEAGDSEMTGTSSESTEEDDDDPLQGFKDACYEGTASFWHPELLASRYFSYLVRVPGLKEVDIKLERSLNSSWKSNILFLVNNHPTLQRLRMEFLDEYVMDNDGEPLEIKRPDCTVIIKVTRNFYTYIFRKNFHCEFQFHDDC